MVTVKQSHIKQVVMKPFWRNEGTIHDKTWSDRKSESAEGFGDQIWEWSI